MTLSLKFISLTLPFLPFAFCQDTQGWDYAFDPEYPKWSSGQNVSYAFAVGDGQPTWIRHVGFTPAQLNGLSDLLTRQAVLNTATNDMSKPNPYVPPLVANFAPVNVEDPSTYASPDDAVIGDSCGKCPTTTTDQAMIFPKDSPDWNAIWQTVSLTYNMALSEVGDYFKMALNLWTNDQYTPANPLCTTLTLESLQPKSQSIASTLKQDMQGHFQDWQYRCQCRGVAGNAFGGGTRVMMRGGQPKWRMGMTIKGGSCVPW